MSIFDTFNNKFGQFGMPANLGLLATGIGLLEGQDPLEAVKAGIGTYGSFEDIEEDRRRKAALLQLSKEYGDDPRIQQLIKAFPEAAVSLIANLEVQRRKPTAKYRNLTAEELAAKGFPEGTVAQINDTSGQINVLTKPTKATKPGTATGVDKFLRYTDGPNKGERVFPDAVKPENLSNLQEKANLLKDAGILAGSVEYNKAMFGITPEKDSTFVEKQKALIDAGIQEGSPQYLQALFNITPEKQSAFAEKQQALISSGFTEGTDEYNQALFGIKDEPLSAFQEKRNALIDDGIAEGSKDWNKALYGITPKDPKPASLVNLIADKDITVGGITYKAGQRFSLDQNTQQDLIIEAAGQGAIKAPTKIEQTNNVAGDEVEIPVGDASVSPISPINIPLAAGGDVPGVFRDIVNKGLGFLTATAFPDRTDEKTNLAALESLVMPNLVKQISSQGSVRTQQDVKRILPNDRDNDSEMRSKVERLIPVLEQKLREAISAQREEGLTATQKTLSVNVVNTFPNLIASLRESLIEFERNYGNTGGSKTAAQTAADKLLGVD
tara:strand:- start:6974 stop:8635 length:1662 start_codon:yes stop_codon:yes gene_type:complete